MGSAASHAADEPRPRNAGERNAEVIQAATNRISSFAQQAEMGEA